MDCPKIVLMQVSFRSLEIGLQHPSEHFWSQALLQVTTKITTQTRGPQCVSCGCHDTHQHLYWHLPSTLFIYLIKCRSYYGWAQTGKMCFSSWPNHNPNQEVCSRIKPVCGPTKLIGRGHSSFKWGL